MWEGEAAGGAGAPQNPGPRTKNLARAARLTGTATGVYLGHREGRAAKGGRMRYARFVLLALIALAALLVPSNAARAASGIIVDSTGDTDARDGVLTLREAILLATGGLAVGRLDGGEADNVTGTPGAASADTVQFSSAQ